MMPQTEFEKLLDERLYQLTLYVYWQKFGVEHLEDAMEETEADLMCLTSNPYLEEVAAQYDAQRIEVLKRFGYGDEMSQFQKDLRERILAK